MHAIKRAGNKKTKSDRESLPNIDTKPKLEKRVSKDNNKLNLIPKKIELVV